MKFSLIPVRSHRLTLGLLALCAGLLVCVYMQQLAGENSSTGMQPWELTSTGAVILVAGLLIGSKIISVQFLWPSDFFRLFYTVIVLLSYVALHPVSGSLSEENIVIGFLVMLFPVMVLQLLDKAVPKLHLVGILPPDSSHWFVLAVLLTVTGAAMLNSPDSAGFGLYDSAVRRMEGRAMYPAGSWIAYGLAMSMNGFAPFIAFVGGLRLRLYLLVIAVIFVGFCYWLVGVKAPLLYVLASAVLGMLVRWRKTSNMTRYSLYVLIGLGLLVGLEWITSNNHSEIADYFFRRLFVAPAQVQAIYVEFVMGDKPFSWSWLKGLGDLDIPVSYYIGERFFGDARSNVNTNAFLFQLASSGMWGYCIAVTAVASILVVFDRLYASSGNPNYMFLGFLYGLLVVEQAYSVAFVSSGVGALLVLTLLERYPSMGQSAVVTSTPDG